MSKRDYFRAIPAVYILLEHGDEILLIQRANTGYMDSMYSLPAGHVEQGESLKAAAIRETLEEVGITVAPAQLKLVHVMNRPTSESHDETRLDFYFICDHWSGKPYNKEPEKCSDLRWCKRDKLPTNMIPEVHQAVALAGRGIIESEFGWGLDDTL